MRTCGDAGKHQEVFSRYLASHRESFIEKVSPLPSTKQPEEHVQYMSNENCFPTNEEGFAFHRVPSNPKNRSGCSVVAVPPWSPSAAHRAHRNPAAPPLNPCRPHRSRFPSWQGDTLPRKGRFRVASAARWLQSRWRVVSHVS